MPECSAAENVDPLFLWMVTHSPVKKNLLLLKVFSPVSLDDLFTKPQAFAVKPSHPVLSWIKTQLHHSVFHQLTPKAHPKGYKNCTCGKDDEQALTCPCPAFSVWMRFCYRCHCFHCINDGNWIQTHEIYWGRCAIGNLSPLPTHTRTQTVVHTQ